MLAAAAQQRAAVSTSQPAAAAARCHAPAAVAPRPGFVPAPSSGSGGIRGSGSVSSAAARLPPVCARRERDPIVAPVIQMGPQGEDIVDLYSFLMRNRIIFLNQRISDQVATQVVASLLALDSLDPDQEIKMYINCPQGSPYSVVAILDTMRALRAPVSTVAFGMVGGTAAAVLAGGAKGRRYAMPNARILLQQPMGGLQGSADECNITATELNRNMRVMYRFLSEATGLSEEQIEMECDRDNFLSPKQALDLGLIDGLIE
ncbi:ATP-dependent Clp protease proteolytic subunit [Micractinium conductrix]|uniref:ATP-dependent Clp protease proteolytic subunit n=1 Tax=Micractinium conductrix TaxID=554055 RepID=A0A2P6VMT2_9CHLO|nr:ATP-dependent Clp protease proteolytic subunit [Micractinium conductrix]|eukprot:PSC75394.1 ATP-dependent Clp protease proteolytic subunit [Micractinium conductrix]